MTLLTDRSLYRPGQTVYVKGIAYSQKSDTANVLPNKEYMVTLLDANNQEVGQNRYAPMSSVRLPLISRCLQLA